MTDTLHTITIPRTNADGEKIQIKVTFDHEYKGRDTYRSSPHYDATPSYYATVHMHEANYVPAGKRLPVDGYFRVRVTAARDVQYYGPVSWDGGNIHRAGVFGIDNLLDGYSGALVDDFGPDIAAVFKYELATVEAQARAYEAGSMEERAGNLEAHAEELRDNAAKARDGSDYLTRDEIDRTNR